MYSNNYTVILNFLALTTQNFTFIVYRKLISNKENKPDRDIYVGTLPIQSNNKDVRDRYWISLSPRDGFENFTCHSTDNHYLTLYFLYHKLKHQLSNFADESQYSALSYRFTKAIFFTIKEHREGKEVIKLEPYYLSTDRKFGFLIDFEFHKKEGIPFNRTIQKLSLSLDNHFRSNKNFYIDKSEKIKILLVKDSPLYKAFPIVDVNGTEINIENNLHQLEANTLNSKTYIFNEDKEGQSPFKCIRDYGPLEPLTEKACFYFAFMDEARDYAVDLYKALRGQLHPTTFPGLSVIFKLSIEKENTSRSSVKKFDGESINKMISEIKTENHQRAIQIVILNSKTNKQVYYDLKHSFLKEKIPLQIITLDLLKNKEAFKWSVSNIALQIFAKLGGKPWKVKPDNQNCLIIGIGQAHKLTKTAEGRTVVNKYFAYSVLIDSSGLYKDIEILSSADDKHSYAAQIQSKIEEIVRKYNSEYRKFVIHTPFKLKNKELHIIQKSLEKISADKELGEIELVVIKINTKNKFFGYYNQSNSLVPYESTYLQISFKDFLIWFEGIQPKKSNVYKRFSGPTHIQFYYSNNELSYPEKIRYLQDIINLSGANWRGFNAKSLPVSIYYCQLIARRIKEFNSLGYPDIQIEDSNPWFL